MQYFSSQSAANDAHISPEIELTDASFSSEILQFSGVALVDFWAPWCGPCRMMAQPIEELAAEFVGHAKICKMNVDENPVTPSQFGVMGIPSIKIFKNGQIVEEFTGITPKATLAASVLRHSQEGRAVA